MDEKISKQYTAILKHELAEAMGCTEPIAVAYAGSIAERVLGKLPDHVKVLCSGNMIKNVKGVKVPHSGGHRGIDMAVMLGIVGGDPDKELAVLEDITDDDRQKAVQLLDQNICTVQLKEGVPNLYIDVVISAGNDEAEAELQENHRCITLIRHNQQILHQQKPEVSGDGLDPMVLNLKGILEYAEQVPLTEVSDVLKRQIDDNTAISEEGLKNAWGQQVGRTLISTYGDSRVEVVSRAMAAAGSDARMSGCAMPVIINSGSGNQGITVTMPVVAYARKQKATEEQLMRALIIANLVSVHIKSYIGSLSAFCGATSAAAGAASGVCWLLGGGYDEIGATITNTLGTVSGMVCDGAKSSCAGKISCALEAALTAMNMARMKREFQNGEGLVRRDVEETIRAYGQMARDGMKSTDHEILELMLQKDPIA